MMLHRVHNFLFATRGDQVLVAVGLRTPQWIRSWWKSGSASGSQTRLKKHF